MSAQTTYTQLRGQGYPGLLYGHGPVQKDSYQVETAAGIAPGLAVSGGTADDQVVIGGTAPLGVTIRTLDVENNASDAIVYDQYTTVSVLTRGDILVSLGNTGSKGDPIYSTNTTGVISAGYAGYTLTPVADGGNTGDGTCTVASVIAGSVPVVGAYNLECTAAVTNGGVFKLEDPNGVTVATGVAMDAGAGGTTVIKVGGLQFTLTDGATDFVVGDKFALTVASDGTTQLNGKLMETVTAAGIARIRLLEA